MGRRIQQEDTRIDRLIQNLQRREQRYFVTFGRLESAMIAANSQMMFLEQLFWMG
jgi:flagellar capping protein FliD